MKICKLRVLLGSLFPVAALAASLAAPVMAQVPVFSRFTGTVTIDLGHSLTGLPPLPLGLSPFRQSL